MKKAVRKKNNTVNDTPYLLRKPLIKRDKMYVCMYVCIFIKLHITAQSGPVIRVIILCHSH